MVPQGQLGMGNLKSFGKRYIFRVICIIGIWYLLLSELSGPLMGNLSVNLDAHLVSYFHGFSRAIWFVVVFRVVVVAGISASVNRDLTWVVSF